MQTLAEKITKMVAEQGLVKFEDSNLMGKAAALAAYQGMIREYAKTAGHTIYTVQQ